MELLCSWERCHFKSYEKDSFIAHVALHIPDVAVVSVNASTDKYGCLWDGCSFCCDGPNEITRHLKFHAFHTHLKAIGLDYLKKHSLNECVVVNPEPNSLPLLDPFICQWEMCQKEFKCPEKFYKHVASHISQIYKTKSNGKYPCHWTGCKFAGARRNRVVDHIKVHTGEKSVACPNCGFMFANKTKFANHCARQTLGDTAFECPHCHTLHSTERLLKDHMRQHVNHYKCSFCSLTLNSKARLTTHIRYRHLNHRPFQCASCSYGAKSRYDLKQHLARHDKKNNIPIKCTEPDCEFVAKSSYALCKHFLKSHTDEKKTGPRYACHLCSKKYHLGHSLTSHLFNIHNITKPPGFSRFKYNLEEDGYHRLQTIRLENIDILHNTDPTQEENSESEDDLSVADEDETSEGIIIDYYDEYGKKKTYVDYPSQQISSIKAVPIVTESTTNEVSSGDESEVEVSISVAV